jgi:mRNA interferase MazF
MNEYIATAIVVPLTTTVRTYPTRINLRFRGKAGQAALDQIRTIDKARIVKKLGAIPDSTADEIAAVLIEMFRRK